GRIYATLKGVIDAGLSVPHSEDCFPAEARINGEHIQNHVSNVKEGSTQFSSYYKKNLNPGNISEVFKETKKKILES
ncbi:MAG: 50S ribosomal protein L18, partial [Nanoarchaeota archaeon]